MSAERVQQGLGAVLTPGLAVTDPGVAYWLARINLMLRREICWCWHHRGENSQREAGKLPPITDAAAENLDLTRHQIDKRRFFETDVTARFLGEQLENLGPAESRSGVRGSWDWTVDNLALDEAAQLVVALGLAARLDSGLGPVFATCMNDQSRAFASLALAQRLWHDPLAVVACADVAHPIFRYGLLADGRNQGAAVDWQQPLEMPALVARGLVNPDDALPRGIKRLSSRRPRRLDDSGEISVARLNVSPEGAMQIVPLLGHPGTAFEDWAATVGELTGRPVAAVADFIAAEPSQLTAVAAFSWLRGLDLMLPEHWLEAEDVRSRVQQLSVLGALPLRWYLPMSNRDDLRRVQVAEAVPALRIHGLSFEERVSVFTRGLGPRGEGLTPVIEECARRFRLQERAIEQITRTFANGSTQLDARSLLIACRNEATSEFGELARFIEPRFGADDLILPRLQRQQFQEVVHAMRALTQVHYHWGTARVWNESGLSVLFSGVPGTGKTMAAEALALTLDLPLFRIDLSQVVNKYIGETEKNLKRIFDAAEISDCILFFDEADALFGKRTEVKDAHDRFANVEISYLLERMENFKGLAILATNRRKDLDEAFKRRLRYVIEFPMPGVQEREEIWRRVFPGGIDLSEVNFPYLAKQFALSGGHIRSIAFNACLQSASPIDGTPGNPGEPSTPTVSMDKLLIAVKRELEKTNRTASEELFGSYSKTVRELVA